MAGGVYLIQGDGGLVEMTEQTYGSEDKLQEMLVQHPNLLAGDEEAVGRIAKTAGLDRLARRLIRGQRASSRLQAHQPPARQGHRRHQHRGNPGYGREPGDDEGGVVLTRSLADDRGPGAGRYRGRAVDEGPRGTGVDDRCHLRRGGDRHAPPTV